MYTYGSAGLGNCGPSWVFPGGGGGGTLVLEAAGRIDVHGRVSANGSQLLSGGSVGSGGSILLRGFAGVTVHPSGLVQATAEPNTSNAYPPGIIRLDGYGGAPVLLGVVDPSPTVLELPYLQQAQPPVLGNNWQLRVLAPRGDGVSLAASFAAGSTTNQFGTVRIDLANAVMLVFLRIPNTGHDPYAIYQLAVPNVPAYLGLPLHVAGLDWATNLSPRFTNTIHTIVQ